MIALPAEKREPGYYRSERVFGKRTALGSSAPPARGRAGAPGAAGTGRDQVPVVGAAAIEGASSAAKFTLKYPATPHEYMTRFT